MDSTSTAATASATTSAPSPIVIGSGESPATFDELDQVEAAHKAAKRAQKKEAKEVVKEAAKEVTAAVNKSKEEKVKDEAEETSEQKTQGEKQGKKEEQKDLDAKANDKKNADKVKKLIKAKLGEKESEIDPEMLIPHMIDGKEELISLKDLLSQNSGRVSYDKRFSELDRERQKFYQKFDDVSSKIKRIMDEKDPELKFFHMAEFAGQDPMEVRANFLNNHMNLLEQWYAMSEDERKAANQAYENKILKYRLESKAKEESRRNAQVALQDKIKGLGEAHQISDQEFWGMYDKFEAAKKSGNFNEKVTPELIAEAVVKERIWGAVAPILESAESFNDSQKIQILRDLTEDAYKIGLTPEEVKEVALAKFGKKAKETVIEEKVKEQEELRTGKKESKPKPVDEAPAFFDEIM